MLDFNTVVEYRNSDLRPTAHPGPGFDGSCPSERILPRRELVRPWPRSTSPVFARKARQHGHEVRLGVTHIVALAKKAGRDKRIRGRSELDNVLVTTALDDSAVDDVGDGSDIRLRLKTDEKPIARKRSRRSESEHWSHAIDLRTRCEDVMYRSGSNLEHRILFVWDLAPPVKTSHLRPDRFGVARGVLCRLPEAHRDGG